MANKRTALLPVFVLITLVASGSVVTSQVVGNNYHAIVTSLWSIILLFVLLTFGNSTLVAKFLLPYIQTDPSPGSLWIDTGDRLNDKPPDEISDEVLIDVIADSFPLSTFLLISISLTFLLFYDFTLEGELPNQSYGLLLNGYGAIILSIDAQSPSLYPNVADVENNLRKAITEFWGFIILSLGFILQILQLIV